jgi:lipopolysaccharide transport system ATP-binding protein
MDPLLRLERVSKVYPRVHRPRERLQAFTSLLMGREPREGVEVLSDVSLEVLRGQSLGIIGENGAGKSTLLKVLTGVIKPSRGAVTVNASIAALLELGAGFQPDFSGMDNVRMKASLLGIGQRELERRMDRILDFADIGDYIHEPVKHYSSGMVVRLGFAVVAASEPDVLITDEVLAVGDESFQKKCVRWIDAFLERGGTLLLVSHSMYLVQKLCTRALWLDHGRMRAYGDVHRVTQDYLAWHEQRSSDEAAVRREVSGDQGLYSVRELRLNGADGGDIDLAFGADLEIELLLQSPDERMPVGLLGLVRVDGTPVYGVATHGKGRAVQPERLGDSHYRYRVRFPSPGLLPGHYLLRGHAMDPEGLRVCDTVEHSFRVTGESEDLGLVRLHHEWLGPGAGAAADEAP